MESYMRFEITGTTSLHEFLGDFIVYRNLVPSDPRLPSIADLREQLHLGAAVLPRKADPDYGRVLAEILRRARGLSPQPGAIERLVYIGDTRLLDGTAFRNLCAAGGWPGWAFIASEDLASPRQTRSEPPLYLANRWSALTHFLVFLEGERFALDGGTAVVVDVDKTAIGARGRNDKVIDMARVEGVKRTVADLLGPRFDEVAFRLAYDELNQPTYHTFTADNQDYLAYICLVLGAGLVRLEDLLREVRAGSLASFQDFIAGVQRRPSDLAPSGLASIHDEVWRCVEAGDPTPFKAFRYNEYLTTVARFGDLPGASPEEVLSQRIVITEEVRSAALALKERGCLLFGVSDKPDEAYLPSPEQARKGLKPLHRLETLAVGGLNT
jgi:hypothetical protein